jgi:hypothetical protein
VEHKQAPHSTGRSGSGGWLGSWSGGIGAAIDRVADALLEGS